MYYASLINLQFFGRALPTSSNSMRIFIPSGLNFNQRDFLRRLGYATFMDPFTKRLSFTKRLTTGNYPRFHVYLEKDKTGRTYISLHLDQKKPSYAGAHAHSAEYDGPTVEREGSKIQRSIHALNTKKDTQTNETQGFSIFKHLFNK